MTTSTTVQQQQATTIIPNTICPPVSDDNDSIFQIGLHLDDESNDDALSEVQVRKSIRHEGDDNDDDDDLECISAVSSNNDDDDENDDEETIENDKYNDDAINPNNNMRRVSSCFFSVASGYSRSSFSDLRGLVIEEEVKERDNKAKNQQQRRQQEDNDNGCFNAVDILYHDIMMNILSFLPLSSLSSFSATARRPNFECFYFLQLQFERSLSSQQTTGSSSSSSSSLFPSISGTGAISRLSSIDPTLAKKLVNDYLDSNSSLRNMPLSQRLAYMIRDGKFMRGPCVTANNNNMAAAMLVLLGGACASYMGTEIPSGAGQALLSMGLGGAIMQAASSKRLLTDDGGGVGREAQAAASASSKTNTTRRNNYHIPVPHFPNIFHHNKNNTTTATATTTTTTNSPRTSRKTTTNNNNNTHNNETKSNDTTSDYERDYILSAMQHPHTSNPYSHVSPIHPPNNTKSYTPEKKTPTGCVGAYTKSIRRATMELTKRVKQTRLTKFKTLPLDEQIRRGTRFIDACTSNDGLDDLKRIVQREGIDVDGFYVGSDGTETCGLHVAAFHGASEIVRYLCSPIDEYDAEKDGGLCNIDLRDDNGWTACHFASGANSVASVKILAEMGADLTIEAGNGYTPYHWAERLSNEEVMACLKGFGADERFLELRKWVGGAESLWLFGERFWGMIPAGNG